MREDEYNQGKKWKNITYQIITRVIAVTTFVRLLTGVQSNVPLQMRSDISLKVTVCVRTPVLRGAAICSV